MGRNGSFFLNNTTVTTNGLDKLFGSSTGRNWFFFHQLNEIKQKNANDFLTQI